MWLPIKNLIRGHIKGYEKSIADSLNKKSNEIVNEELDEETINKRVRQNNMEFKIGVNWINKLGMLLILIGISTALKYTLEAEKEAFLKIINNITQIW